MAGAFNKTIIGSTGENVHIEPDFWCDYGYRISVGENFYANHGLVILDAGSVTFGNDVFKDKVKPSDERAEAPEQADEEQNAIEAAKRIAYAACTRALEAAGR